MRGRQIFEDTTVAAAILDRLLHHATVLLAALNPADQGAALFHQLSDTPAARGGSFGRLTSFRWIQAPPFACFGPWPAPALIVVLWRAGPADP